MTKRSAQPAHDERALRMLDLLGEAHQDVVPAGAARADLARALRDVVDVTVVPTPSDAEAAGTALQLLGDDPRFAEPIEAMKSGPQTRSLGPGMVEGAFVVTWLLLALQTHFEFERDKDGRWAVKIKKKPTSEALLKPLIKKLTDLLGG